MRDVEPINLADGQTLLINVKNGRVIECAVLVIDVQQGLFNTDPPPYRASEVLQSINELTTKARKAGVPVIMVQHDGNIEDGVEPFSPGWQLHSDLLQTNEDWRLRKTTCDAFFETELENRLRGQGIRRLVLAGYATDFCIDSTLRNAVSKGFEVVIAADAHTTHDSSVLAAKQVCAHHNWAWANCTTKHPVSVLRVAQIIFSNFSRAV